MGRKIPYQANPLVNDSAISLSFLAAGIAAIIAIVAMLCGTRWRKKISRTHSSASPPSCTPEKVHSVTTTHTTTTKTKTKVEEEETPSTLKSEEMDTSINELWANVHSTKPLASLTMPRKKLTVSLSMRHPGGFSMNHTRREQRQQQQQRQHKEHDEKRKKTGRSEDSLWMKTIILGEKCKIPSDEDDILYDAKGNRVLAYHPKTPRSLPVSRTNSYIDPKSLPF